MMSMTGFGQALAELDGLDYLVELRSVNARFLDVKLHLPWSDTALEARILEIVRRGLARGRIEVSLRVADRAAGTAPLTLDRAVARSVASALIELVEIVGHGADVAAVATLLPQQRDLLVAARPSSAQPERIAEAVSRALAELLCMRARDGGATRDDLAGHLAELSGIVQAIGEHSRESSATLALKLRERVGRLVADLDWNPDRLAQEVALLADRCDVSEELARLDSHLGQLRGMLDSEGPVGRKLEFMLQEANREVNTIASKTTLAEVSRLAVEGKSCLERMREQVQNIE